MNKQNSSNTNASLKNYIIIPNTYGYTLAARARYFNHALSTIF